MCPASANAKPGWVTPLLITLAVPSCGRIGFDAIAIEGAAGGASGVTGAAGGLGGAANVGGAGLGGVTAGGASGSGGATSGSTDAGDVVTVEPPPSGWSFRKGVVVDADSVAAALTDFPLLVSVDADAELAAGVAQSNGADIRFTGMDGTQLDHEIELFESTTGELVAWVRLPSVSATEPTEFYLDYGNPTAADQQNPAGVWESRYLSVWHMAESPGPGGTGEIVDSTGTSPGTPHATMEDGDLVSGQIGPAIDFDGVDDEITFVNTFTGTDPHTISAWVNQRTTTTVDAIVVFGEDIFNHARWFYTSFGADHQVSMGFYTNDIISMTDVRGAGFTHLAWTYDGSTSRLYVDGALAEDAPHSGADTSGSAGWIGNVFVPGARGFGSDLHLDGQLDEIRIFRGVLSAERLQAEFDNQASPAIFAVVGRQIP